MSWNSRSYRFPRRYLSWANTHASFHPSSDAFTRLVDLSCSSLLATFLPLPLLSPCSFAGHREKRLISSVDSDTSYGSRAITPSTLNLAILDFAKFALLRPWGTLHLSPVANTNGVLYLPRIYLPCLLNKLVALRDSDELIRNWKVEI